MAISGILRARVEAAVRGQALAALTPILGGPQAAQVAQAIAANAGQVYANLVNSGTPHAQAEQAAFESAGPEIERAAVTPEQRQADAAAAAAPTTSISPEDTNAALGVFRDAVTGEGQPYSGILERPDVVITPGVIAPSKAEKAERIKAALQRRIEVEGTELDTTQSDTARLLQLRNIQELEAQARGEGAVQQAAEARQKMALLRSAQQSTGLIQQARGADRRGLRRAELFQRGERQVATQLGLEEQAATQAQAAGQALVTATGDVRTADIDIEKTRSDLKARRNELQAQLDSAKEAGDQTAINTITVEIARLDQDITKFNAEQEQKAATRTAELGQDAQTDSARITNERDDVKLRATESVQKAAKGLLDEQGRQDMLRFAREQLAFEQEKFEEEKRANASREQLARREQNIRFWGGIISGLLTTATTLAAPGAKHGGITSGVTIAGEAGPEIVIPIKGKLSAALMRKFAVDKEPFKDRPIPAKKLASLLAAANVSERRQKGT